MMKKHWPKNRIRRKKIRSVAITNLAATWKQKFLMIKTLKRKQKKYPRTTYVTAKGKVLVERWGLLDHSYNVLVLGSNGNFLFNQAGALAGVEVENLTALNWSQISN